MGFGLAGAAGANNASSAGNSIDGNINAFQELQETMVEATKIFDNEAQAVTNNKMAKGGVEQSYGQEAAPEQGQVDGTDQILQAAADMFTDELDKKKKLVNKKTKFEEKLDTLGKLESLIDEKQVDGEDRGIIQEFFDNMSRIKNLRGRLKQLEQEEQYLEQQQQQHEQQQERERRKKEQEEKNEGDEQPPQHPYHRHPQ